MTSRWGDSATVLTSNRADEGEGGGSKNFRGEASVWDCNTVGSSVSEPLCSSVTRKSEKKKICFLAHVAFQILFILLQSNNQNFRLPASTKSKYRNAIQERPK